jgi:sec-independent protein translocase protein TatB
MFEIGYSEILVIAIVLIVVVGPKDLPKMLRAFGKTMTKFRQMSGDFQRQFNDALKEAELDEVRKTIADVRKLDPRQQVRDVFNPLRDAGNALKADLNKTVQAPVAPAVVATAAVADKPVAVTMGGAAPAVAKAIKPTKASTAKASTTKASIPKAVAPKAIPAKTEAPKKVAPKVVAMASPKVIAKKAEPSATKTKQSKGKTVK